MWIPTPASTRQGEEERPPAQKGRKKVIKLQLMQQTSRETGYSLDEIEEILSSAINICLRTLSRGEVVKLSDFGRFSLSKTGRLVFHPYLYTKKVVRGEVETPKEPQTLYKVRRTKVRDSFKECVEPVAAPREIRRISTAEPERVDYEGLVEN